MFSAYIKYYLQVVALLSLEYSFAVVRNVWKAFMYAFLSSKEIALKVSVLCGSEHPVRTSHIAIDCMF